MVKAIKYIKKIVQWCLAMIVAFAICNIIIMFYHRPAGWIDRRGAATDAIWHPGATLIHGTEGHGVYKVDSNGYLNPDLPLAKEYVLIVGASYVQGKEVQQGKRVSDLLNSALAISEDELKVYNVSQDAFFFPAIVNAFPALLKEFPDAKTIVIDIGDTDFTDRELEEALIQREYDPSQTGNRIMNTLSLEKKISITIKEYLPILTLIKKQIVNIDRKRVQNNVLTEETASEMCIEKVLKRIRHQFDGRLVILYHPSVNIRSDGMLVVERKESVSTFQTLCQQVGIDFLDVSEAFLREYENDFSVPYGFNDTSIGNGHFNEKGHAIIAEELEKELKDG